MRGGRVVLTLAAERCPPAPSAAEGMGIRVVAFAHCARASRLG